VDVNGETIIGAQGARCDESSRLRADPEGDEDVGCGGVLEVQSNGSGAAVAPLELFEHTLAEVGSSPPKRAGRIYAPGRVYGFSPAERLG